jgi:POT family proton-dependent oligopeptide transporter
LFVFWLGRHKFVHVPPAGWNKFKTETFSLDGRRALLNLAPIFLIFVPMFWALFDQTGSAWVLQADKMNRTVMGITILPSQIQAANPILILILIPMFSYVIYPWLNKFFKVTALRKISIGLFITVAAFAISSWIEGRVVESAPAAAEALWTALGTTGAFDSNGLEQALSQAAAVDLDKTVITNCLSGMPGIVWQIIAYIVITIAEVMVSITTLEFAYTQAPKKMKSFIMGVYFLGISLGNLFTAAVNKIIQNEDGTSKLDGADYYWFFTALMAVTAVAFVFYAMRYKGRTYIQGEKPDGDVESESEAAGVGNV